MTCIVHPTEVSLKWHIAELEADLAAEIAARKEEYNRAEDRQVEVERLRELIIHYRIMDKDELDAALAAIGEGDGS